MSYCMQEMLSFEYNIEKNKNSKDKFMTVVTRAAQENYKQLSFGCTRHVYVCLSDVHFFMTGEEQRQGSIQNI